MKSLLHEVLRERLRFFITTYQHHGGSFGRGWVEFDGVEIAQFVGRSGACLDEGAPDSRQRFFEALRDYPTLPLEELRASDNEILRAISLCDRRFGQKRFLAFDIEHETSDLVRVMYRTRKQALERKEKAVELSPKKR